MLTLYQCAPSVPLPSAIYQFQKTSVDSNDIRPSLRSLCQQLSTSFKNRQCMLTVMIFVFLSVPLSTALYQFQKPSVHVDSNDIRLSLRSLVNSSARSSRQCMHKVLTFVFLSVPLSSAIYKFQKPSVHVDSNDIRLSLRPLVNSPLPVSKTVSAC